MNFSIKRAISGTIKRRSFYGCEDLSEVNLPYGLKRIGTGAFAYCSSLKDVVIPNSVDTMETSVFSICTSLSSVTISTGLTYIPEYTFSACEKLSSIIIPESIVDIQYKAFYESGLKSVVIPNNVTQLGEYAFYQCKQLESVIIPESVVSIGNSAFANCSKLTSVVINSNTLVSVNNNKPFNNCSSNLAYHYYYDVVYYNDGNGTVRGKNRTFGTDVIELNVTPKELYTVNEITLSYSNKTIVVQPDDNGVYKCTMPDSNGIVSFDASFIKGRIVNVISSANGKVNVSKNAAKPGESIIVSATPNEGYKLDSILLNGKALDGNTFVMPDEDVTVEAIFVDIRQVNTLKVTGGKTAKIKYKKLRKKAQAVSRAKLMTVSAAQGTVTYKIVKVSKKKTSFKINANNGVVTVKKKLKKGTYTLWVSVTATGNDEYKPITKTVAFKIKVK